MREWLLEKYIILKTLKQNSKITRYKLYTKVKKILNTFYISQFYMIMRRLEKEGYIKSEVSRIKNENIILKNDSFWKSDKGKIADLYYITGKGELLLKELEMKIKSILI